MEPEQLVLGVTVLALTLYAVLGGADFGAGVWEFSTGLRAGARERALSYRAIGPVWEANHVWLIFALVTVWTGFPGAYAALCRALWVPLLLALLGIVFRGAAYAFRSYSSDADQRQLWEAVFASASTLAPFFLGSAAGAIASGRLEIDAQGVFSGDSLSSWFSATAFFGGLFFVAACGHLAAVLLTREAAREGDRGLTRLWRRRALGAGVTMGLLAWAGLGVVAFDAPLLWDGLRGVWPLLLLSAVGGCGSLAALVGERYSLAAVGAGLAKACVVWGWAAAQYPLLIPPHLTIEAAKAPDVSLWFMVGAVGLGSLLLVPALGWLLYLFKTGDGVGGSS